jgi:hypothetical protein
MEAERFGARLPQGDRPRERFRLDLGGTAAEVAGNRENRKTRVTFRDRSLAGEPVIGAVSMGQRHAALRFRGAA